MRTLTINKKLKALAIAMFAGFGTVNADNTLSADKLFISAGETKIVTVNLSNDEDVTVVGMDIYLPEGLSFVATGNVDPATETVPEMASSITDRVEDMEVGQLSQKEGREFGVLVIYGKIKAGTGAIATFKVKADDNYAADAAEIKYRNTGKNFQEFTSKVIKGNFQVTLSMDDILIKKGGEAKADICLENIAEEIWGCGLNITLPEGLDITEAVTTERSSNKNIIFKHLTDREVYIDLHSMDKKLITGSKGAIVTLTFKAAEDLEEGVQVKLYNFQGNTWEGVQYLCDDVVSTVKIDDETTGIESVNADGNADVDGSSEAVYDLSGKRISKETKGIQIRKVNGKAVKVIVK